MNKAYDDYCWPDYTPTYANTHNFAGAVHYLRDSGFKFTPGGGIEFSTDLNGNIKQLAHQILANRDRINSVYECGCGAGWNSLNILKIFPALDISGSDLVQAQIDFGRKHAAEHKADFSPGFYDRLSAPVDMSSPDAPSIVGKTFDLVFCQAVIMHLMDERGVQFIKNMMKLSNRYVMLCENLNYGQNFSELLEKAGVSSQFSVNYTTGPFAANMIWMEKI